MSDIAITAGVGTVVSTDAIAGRHYQKVKLTWGADGVANDLTYGLPTIPGLPLTQALTWGTLSFSTAAANDVVAAGGAGTRVKIYVLVLSVAAPTTVTFLDSTPTNFSGAMSFVTGGGIVLPPIGEPWFRCGDNKKFQITLGTAVQTSGFVGYLVS